MTPVWSCLFPTGNLTRQIPRGGQGRRSGECPWTEPRGGPGVLGNPPEIGSRSAGGEEARGSQPEAEPDKEQDTEERGAGKQPWLVSLRSSRYHRLWAHILVTRVVTVACWVPSAFSV